MSLKKIMKISCVALSALGVVLTTPQSVEAKAPETFSNPILAGYHPDPSICRVGEDYYLINSSFEWYPAIPIYKSRDLVNWKLIGYGGSNPEKFAFKPKVFNSGGIFAPTIRHHDGVFYIITTDIGGIGNFYITATDPAGEWSEPVQLHSPGIDPSLFWDDDGRCYYIGHNSLGDKRQWVGHNEIYLQELDLEAKKLVGERSSLTSGHASNAQWTEGPHLYKIDGRYLLIVAEGGTSRNHAVTTFQSDSLRGAYVPDQVNPILTHRHLGYDVSPSSTGHADFTDTQNGEWWMVALACRHSNGYNYLARETFLTPMTIEKVDGALQIVVNPGHGRILEEERRPNLEWSPVEPTPEVDNFDGDKLALEWNFLRTPLSKWHSVKGGTLSVELRAEVASTYCNPSLIAKRIESTLFEATTALNFSSTKQNEQAGMILYRSSNGFVTLLREGNEIVATLHDYGEAKELARVPWSGKHVVLGLCSDGKDVSFKYGAKESKMQSLNVTTPLSIVSTEHNKGFNGSMVGVYATSNGEASSAVAKFDWFRYIDK